MWEGVGAGRKAPMNFSWLCVGDVNTNIAVCLMKITGKRNY